jgi:hypothetical protein
MAMIYATRATERVRPGMERNRVERAVPRGATAAHRLDMLRAEIPSPVQRAAVPESEVIQREQPATPEALLANRIGASDTQKAVIENALPDEAKDDDAKNAAIFRSARDALLGITATGLLDAYVAAVVPARNEVQRLVDEADLQVNAKFKVVLFDQEFRHRVGELSRGNPLEKKTSAVMQYFAEKAVNAHLAHEFVTRGGTAGASFGTALNDQGLEHAKTAYDASPDTLRLVRRLLGDAQAETSRPRRLYMLARAIRDLGSIEDSAMAQTASAILADVLRPQISALVNAYRPGDDDTVTWSLFDDVKSVGTGGVLTDLPKEDPLWATIAAAWTVIERVVSPAVLTAAGPCNIRVHSGWFYRQNYSNGTINVGTGRNSQGVIQHEFGHHLENNGNPARWIKIHQLLYTRSAGRDLKSIFPFTIPYVISSDEKQYNVTMPAWWYTGGWFGYSAKYYSSGSTEVTATAMEIMHKPENVFQLAVRDPELFVAVLGMLRE